METCTTSAAQDAPSAASVNPQFAILDAFFPGVSLLFTAIQKYLKVDLYLYIPAFLFIGASVYSFQYTSEYLWGLLESFFMSTADIRIDDEMYNFVMAWVAAQKFAKRSRRFVANTNLNSRSWHLYFWDDEEENEDDEDSPSTTRGKKKNKELQYTPSFGTHYFFWNGGLYLFKRTQNPQQSSYVPASERVEISVCSFNRNPAGLKALLEECRATFQKNDMNKTLIYRGALKPGTVEPQWIRSMSRVNRPFSTVVLDESVKQNLLDDMSDYLHPSTRRWYSNRGIPYRRGYLLYGPPGTGKSSLSFAIAGYFKLKIYIVSLNSPSMNEENLGTLFGELPKQCVVLLEDIDTAGLTHTRETTTKPVEESKETPKTGAPTEVTKEKEPTGRLSLSALLNIIDGVASQEGRILIMTTNHIEKLDKALIRPGRVDMTVKFNLADSAMTATIFRAIFATLEGDMPMTERGEKVHMSPKAGDSTLTADAIRVEIRDPVKIAAIEEQEAQAAMERAMEERKAEEARIATLADAFALAIPSHSFSPAEIQGYLLKYKREPEKAVAMAGEWVKTVEADRSRAEAEKIKIEAEKAKEEAEKKAKEVAGKLKAEAEKEKEQKLSDAAGASKAVNGVSSETRTEESHACGPKTNGIGSSTKEDVKTNGVTKSPAQTGVNGTKESAREEVLTNGVENHSI